MNLEKHPAGSAKRFRHQCRRGLLGAVGLLLSLVCNLEAQLPAFPGAEGAGAYAVGGRYGDVYHVTTLSSSATTAGSFYYGIANAPTAGRTIVFDISGYIHISSTYTLGKSKITIAGQTAPGDGIGFKDGTFNISGSDVIIRHVRFRDGNSADSVDLDNNTNIMMDHCDVMLSNDENLSSFSTPPDNFTFQWCMNSWGMETHSCGGLWDQKHATSHHSLWSHNHTRNPKARPTLLDWVNNVTFDWDIGFIMGDSTSTANWKANVRGCYFVSPPGNTHSAALVSGQLMAANGLPNFSIYLDDCAMDGNGDGILNVSKTGYALASGYYNTNATPYVNTGIPVTRDDYLTAYKKVLSAAGPLRLDANPSAPLRDELNTILVSNVMTQRRHHVSSPAGTGAANGGFGFLNSAPAPADTDHDGMPDVWEMSVGSNSSVDDHTNAVPAGAFVPTGYTLLEEYLQFLSLPHAMVAKNTSTDPTFVDVDLRKFTVGFTNSLPVTYTISNVTNGTVTLTNGYVAHFVPTTNFFGRARFDFTVTDGDSSTWKQTCALLVTAGGLPRNLLWKGGLNANAWDTSTLNWLRSGAATAFSPGDYAAFDDGGFQSPAVNIVGTASAGSVAVNASGNYTFSGTGAIACSGSLVKSGSGTLTLGNSGANSFGAITLDQGAITVGNNNALGSATVTLGEGTTLNMGAYAPTAAKINVDGDSTVTGGSSGGAHGVGAITGSAVLTVNQLNVFDLEGDISAFAGEMRFVGNFAVRFNGSSGSSLATFNLLGSTSIYKRNSTTTINFGGLAGNSAARLSGANGTTSATTYVIGGNDSSTTFAGAISDGGGVVNLTKTGGGLWTLSGSSVHSGATTISGGTLAISGSLSNASPITMSTRTALALQGGSVKAAGITVPAGAIFSGWGSVSGGVTNNGTYHGRGYLTGTAGTLAVAGGLVVNAGAATFMRVGNSGSDRIDVTGNLTLSGTLGVSLAPGSLIGTFTLFTYTGSLTYSPLTLAGLPAGVTGSIDTATAGSVKLVLSSDDNLLDAWEMARFGNLNQGDAGDPDGDGFNNLAEMIAGSMPTNSASTPLDTDGNGIPDAAESFHPYQVDAATLQLWHFDNLSVPLINAANPMHPLLGAHNGATLWTPGPAGFGLAASLNTGTAPNRGIITYGATLDATTNADAPASFIWHGADGAFTIEALVKFDSMPGTWALPGQIVSMEGDGDGTQDRVFQFRIDPSAGVPSLQFFSLASGVGGSLFLPLPTNGLHAPDTNHWFHVALTYDGNPNVAGNLKLYWSRLDATVYPANLLGSGTMVNSFTTQEGDFAIGNEGRATGGSSECFNGSIDEVRISSVARQAGDFFFRDPDSDDDGLPDVWEFAHFGNLTQSGTDDFDHDGTSNRAEYLLGLDPANASSAFRLAIQMSAGSGFTLTWPAQPSLPFSVERATSLSGPWTEIGTLTATSTTGSFTDSNPPTGGRFYRVVMIAP